MVEEEEEVTVGGWMKHEDGVCLFVCLFVCDVAPDGVTKMHEGVEPVEEEVWFVFGLFGFFWRRPEALRARGNPAHTPAHFHRARPHTDAFVFPSARHDRNL